MPNIVDVTYATTGESTKTDKMGMREMQERAFEARGSQYLLLKAFEILSKSVTTQVLKVIQETIEATRIQMTDEEAKILWPKINTFVTTNGKEPNMSALDPLERRLAEALVYLRNLKRNMAANG